MQTLWYRSHDSREAERRMKTRLELQPGQKGAKALVERHDEDFVCVRYRDDEMSRTRIKAVELVVERKALHGFRAGGAAR